MATKEKKYRPKPRACTGCGKPVSHCSLRCPSCANLQKRKIAQIEAERQFPEVRRHRHTCFTVVFPFPLITSAELLEQAALYNLDRFYPLP